MRQNGAGTLTFPPRVRPAPSFIESRRRQQTTAEVCLTGETAGDDHAAIAVGCNSVGPSNPTVA
jgi:hypothetical protein